LAREAGVVAVHADGRPQAQVVMAGSADGLGAEP